MCCGAPRSHSSARGVVLQGTRGSGSMLTLLCGLPVQTNKTFEAFTRHVVRDVWERDFG